MRIDPGSPPLQFLALRIDRDIVDPFLSGESLLPLFHLLFRGAEEREHLLASLGTVLPGVLLKLLPVLFLGSIGLRVRRLPDRGDLGCGGLHPLALLQKLVAFVVNPLDGVELGFVALLLVFLGLPLPILQFFRRFRSGFDAGDDLALFADLFHDRVVHRRDDTCLQLRLKVGELLLRLFQLLASVFCGFCGRHHPVVSSDGSLLVGMGLARHACAVSPALGFLHLNVVCRWLTVEQRTPEYFSGQRSYVCRRAKPPDSEQNRGGERLLDTARESLPGDLDLRYLALVSREASDIVLAGAVSLLAGDLQILGQLRDNRDSLDTRTFEERQRRRVAFESGGRAI